MDLLRFAGRRLRDARVLLIVTFRDDDLATDDQLRVALGELARHRTTRRIALAPLSAGRGAGAGRRQRPGGRRAVPADRRKPVLRDRGPAGRDGGGAGLGPGRRAGPGGRPERRRPAAARGRRADRRPGRGGGCSRRSTGCPPAAVDELLACGLLAADGGRLRFRHEIARLAVEQADPGAPPRGDPRPDPRRAALVRVAGRGARWPSTPRQPATSRRCCGTRPRRRAGRPRWRRTGRPPRSSSGRCGSRRRPTAPRSARPVRRAGRRAALLDRAEEAADASERALELWRAVGDRLREGDATRRLSSVAVAPVPRRRKRSRRRGRGGDPGTAGPGRRAGPGVRELAARRCARPATRRRSRLARRAPVHRRRRGRAGRDQRRAEHRGRVLPPILGREWAG